jgi:hypothetical protein
MTYKISRGWRGLFWSALIPLVFSPWADAHDFGITLIDVSAGEQSIELALQLNQQDILDNVLGEGGRRQRFESTEEVARWSQAISNYVRSRVRVEVDGRRLEAETPMGWPQGSFEIMGQDLKGEPIPAPIPMTLRFRLPPNSSKLVLAFTLYAEGDFLPLYQVTVRRATESWGKTDHLKAHESIVVDLQALRAGSGGRPESLTSVVTRFVVLGLTHILPLGLDHILFVLGLFLLAPGFRPLFKQVTAFTVAHSITLALAMFEIVRLPASVVEPLIALSISVVAFENVFRREVSSWRWLVVFGFGLIHGLGFAGVLSELGLPPGRFLPAVLGFNAGVELGQLAVIGAATILTIRFARRSWYPRYVIVPSSLAIAAVGLYWAIQRIAG